MGAFLVQARASVARTRQRCAASVAWGSAAAERSAAEHALELFVGDGRSLFGIRLVVGVFFVGDLVGNVFFDVVGVVIAKGSRGSDVDALVGIILRVRPTFWAQGTRLAEVLELGAAFPARELLAELAHGRCSHQTGRVPLTIAKAVSTLEHLAEQQGVTIYLGFDLRLAVRFGRVQQIADLFGGDEMDTFFAGKDQPVALDLVTKCFSQRRPHPPAYHAAHDRVRP